MSRDSDSESSYGSIDHDHFIKVISEGLKSEESDSSSSDSNQFFTTVKCDKVWKCPNLVPKTSTKRVTDNCVSKSLKRRINVTHSSRAKKVYKRKISGQPQTKKSKMSSLNNGEKFFVEYGETSTTSGYFQSVSSVTTTSRTASVRNLSPITTINANIVNGSLSSNTEANNISTLVSQDEKVMVKELLKDFDFDDEF